MTDAPRNNRPVPDFVDQAESEYVQLEDQGDDPDIPTIPSGSTVQADRADAVHGHDAGRGPTADEEEAAERAAESAPDVSDPYEEALHRGADIKGEGQILPD